MGRPAPRFHDFVGQRETVRYLRRQLAGAQARSEPFPHSLFSGTSGLGKTFLAYALAAEYQTTVHEAMGDIDRQGLAEKLAGLKANDFLIVDEAHQLRHPEQETLMQAIDRKSVPLLKGTAGKNQDQAPEELKLEPWTLVLATDQPGRLLNALLKRIVIHCHLRPYSVEELRDIVESMATKHNMLITHQAAGLIARVSAGIARKAEMLLRNLRLHFIDAENKSLGVDEIREYLRSAGVSLSGMDRLQRAYLRELAKRETASRDAMALILGADPAFVQNQIEAPLLRRDLVVIDSRGRQLTDKGKALVHRWSERLQEKYAPVGG